MVESANFVDISLESHGPLARGIGKSSRGGGHNEGQNGDPRPECRQAPVIPTNPGGFSQGRRPVEFPYRVRCRLFLTKQISSNAFVS